MAARRRPRLVLAAAIVGSAVVFVDSTVVNVALPAIRADLGGGLALQQWVVDAYLLTLGALLLVGGSLGDVVGERSVLAAGVVAFGVTSALCAAAPTAWTLVAARALQGVAGAILTPASLATLAATFSGEERGAAVGTWTAWSGVATVAGPLAGGALVEAAGWRWIFLVNLPLVGLALWLVLLSVPARDGSRPARHLDVVGGLLCVGGLGGPVFALIEGGRLGWAAPVVLAPLLAGLGLLAAFVAWERRVAQPMLPLPLLRRRNVAAANAETLAVYAGLSILSFFLVLYLQQIAGWSPLEAGLALLPLTGVMFALSPRVGRLAERHGPRLFMTAGPLVAAVGLALLLRLGRHPSYAVDLLPAVLLFALGLALTVAPLTATVLAGAGEADAGVASGVNNAVARVAGLLGIAGAGVAATASGNELDLAGFRVAVAVGAALVALGGLVGAAAIRNPR